MDTAQFMAMLIPLLMLVGGIFLLAMYLVHRQRLRELQIKERIALIEKGLVPSPEVDPGAFDSFVQKRPAEPYAMPDRFRTLGIMLVGVGIALVFLIGFAADDFGSAVGVGGAVVVLGTASVATGRSMERRLASRAPAQPPALTLQETPPGPLPPS
jgi:hypothetical protein